MASSSGGGAYLWSETEGFRPLDVTRAMMLSGNGQVVAGTHRHANNTLEPFLWTAEDGYKILGTFEGWDEHWPNFLSDDGSVVLGHLQEYIQNGDGSVDSEQAATIWTQAGGLRLLEDALADDYGLDLGGWTLGGATGMSDDGRVIVGWGINPDGQHEGWVAIVPEPVSVVLLGAGGLLLRRRRF